MRERLQHDFIARVRWMDLAKIRVVAFAQQKPTSALERCIHVYQGREGRSSQAVRLGNSAGYCLIQSAHKAILVWNRQHRVVYIADEDSRVRELPVECPED